MKKKLFLVCLVLFVALSFAGCGSEKPESSSDNQDSSQNVSQSDSSGKIDSAQAVAIVKDYMAQIDNADDYAFTCVEVFTADNGQTAFTIEITGGPNDTVTDYFVTDTGVIYNSRDGSSLTMALN